MSLQRIFGTTVRATVAFNTASQVLAKIFGAGATFLISLMVARAFGAQGYGDFTKITTFVATFFLFSDFGLNAIYLKQESKDHGEPTQARDPWSILVSLRLLGSFFLIVVALCILAILPRGTEQGYTQVVRYGILLFAPAIVFQALLTTANARFQKHLRYDLSAVSVGIGSFVALAVAIFIMAVPTHTIGPLSGVLAILAGSAVTAAIALLFVRTLGKRIVLGWSFPQMVRTLKSAAPIGATLIFNVIYFRADSFVLTLTRATDEVGIYGFAYKVFEVPLVLPTFFMNSVYPLLLATIGWKGKSPLVHPSDEFRRLISRSLLFLALSSLATTAILWLTAPLLSLIRSEFTQSVAVLRVLALSAPFFFLSSLTMWTLIALGKQIVLAWMYALLMVLNILLNILFVPQFGYMAAAWITVISEGILLLISSFFVLSYLPRTITHMEVRNSKVR